MRISQLFSSLVSLLFLAVAMVPASAADVEGADSFLGIKVGKPAQEIMPHCFDLPASDTSSICYKGLGPHRYHIDNLPQIGFDYALIVSNDEAGNIAYIGLETDGVNAPFLRRLLELRYGDEPTKKVEQIYPGAIGNSSGVFESDVWLGRNIAVVFSVRDLYSQDKSSVTVMHRSAFDSMSKEYEQRMAEMAGKL